MFEKKTISDYSKEISEELGIPEKVVRKVILYGLKNIIKSMQHHSIIYIRSFGHFLFNFRKLVKQIKDERQDQSEGRQLKHVQLRHQRVSLKYRKSPLPGTDTVLQPSAETDSGLRSDPGNGETMPVQSGLGETETPV